MVPFHTTDAENTKEKQYGNTWEKQMPQYDNCTSWSPLWAAVQQTYTQHTDINSIEFLSLWRPLLPYGYSYKASCKLSRHL